MRPDHWTDPVVGCAAVAELGRRRAFTRWPSRGCCRARILLGVLIRPNFREYLDELLTDGFSVRQDEHGSDPDLIDPGGNPVETWREDYPYEDRLDRDSL